MKKLRINRARWLRGRVNSYRPYLKSPFVDGLCCLGFVANRISKMPLKKLTGKANPMDVYSRKSLLTELDEFGCIEDNIFAAQAMNINDDKYIPEPERESLLIQLFKKNGIELSFYGEGHPANI